ncbi:AEC family transporter [Sulfurospirillum sp. 1612]|uniref:AEC family transporter n=1 Tax=Sulfurospirillum sp. 1612 TaxID=3094835 RepID=UPI002F91EFA8
MENFALIIVCVSIGYLFQKLRVFPRRAPAILNQFVLYISMPAIILLEIPTMTLSLHMLIPIVIAWSVMSITAVITFFVSRWMAFSKEVTGALLLVTVLGNTSFVGIPFLNAYYGQESMAYLLVYDQLGTFIFLVSYATFVLSYYSGGSKTSFKIITMKVLTFPPFLSLIVALCFLNTTFPPMMTHILKSLSATIVPLVLIAVGLQLKFKIPAADMKPFVFSSIIKLIISPLLAFLICFTFGWDTLAAKVSIMEAAMPAMITAGAMASMAGLAPRLSSAIVGYGILFSFGTTSVIYYLLG